MKISVGIRRRDRIGDSAKYCGMYDWTIKRVQSTQPSISPGEFRVTFWIFVFACLKARRAQQQGAGTPSGYLL